MIVYGDAPLGDFSSGVSNTTGTPFIDLEFKLNTGAPFVLVDIHAYNTGTPAIDIDLLINTGAPTVDIHTGIKNTGSLSVNLEFADPDLSGYPEIHQTWSIDAIIGGVSYADRLTGRGSIDIEEDSSRLAEFSIVAPAGPFDQMSWIGKNVILYINHGANIKQFNGVVSNAVFFPESGIIEFSCTDDLQGYFENLERTEIDSIIGGYWSEHVFNQADGWAYCQDRLSTKFESLHLDNNRQPVLTSLTAKTAPDFTFTDSESFDSEIELTRATRRDVLNRVRVSIDYRFPRLRQRHIQGHLISGTQFDSLNICDYLVNPYTRCQRAEIESAIKNGGWQLLNITYDPFPDTGIYHCLAPGGLTPFVFSNYLQDKECMAAYWTIAKRWAQTQTEKYTFDIKADNSIEYIGELGLEQRFSLENKYDAKEWESEEFSGVKDGSTVDDNGDYIFDVTEGDNGRTAFENAQVTAKSQAVVSIKKSHRENTVTREVPYHPTVNLSNTVRFESDYLTAQGKVRQIEHNFDFDTGEISTTIQLAISAHGGSGVITDTALDPVTPPETAKPEYQKSFILYHIMGGDPDSQPYREDMEGFITNRNYITGNYIRYDDTGFRINTPEISSEYRDESVETSNNIVNVAINQDVLILSA